MSRPPFEVADIIRISGDSFRRRYSASLTWPQRKVLDAILRCRTAALGGHRDQCVSCGREAISYNSCRNRHCPKCQTGARDRWLAKRQMELLAVGYYHLVFSVPHELVPLMWQNKRQLFSLLFEASAAALIDVAADPKHLGAELGFLAILHTWGQTLTPHPHIHCVVPGGGLAPDHSRWIASPSSFLLPVKVLSRVFRGKFLAGLRRLFARHHLRFLGECMPLHEEKHFALFLRTLFLSARLGGLCQTALRRPRARAALPGPLYASRRHLQPSPALGLSFRGLLSLEGLCSRQQASHDDTCLRRVSAPLRTTCPAERLSPHPLLRLPRQPPASPHAATLPRSARSGSSNRNPFYRRAHTLAVPALSWTHATCRTALRRTDLLRRTKGGIPA